MKKNFAFLLTGCLFLSSMVLSAQQNYHRCSSAEYLNAQLLADPSLATRMQQIEQQTQAYIQNTHGSSRAVVTIPVVVHVVYNTAAQNISDALIVAHRQERGDVRRNGARGVGRIGHNTDCWG